MTILTPANAFPNLVFPQHNLNFADDSRTFNGSSQSASVAINLSAYNKLSLSFWLWQNAYDNLDELACEYTANGGTTSGGFYVDPNSTAVPGKFEINARQGAAFSRVSFTRPSAAAWHHYAILLDNSTSPSTIPFVYVDGASVSLTNGGSGSASANFANSTLYLMSRTNSTLWNAGRVSDFALFGGYLLTSTDAANLAAPTRANAIGQNANLIAYWPVGGYSPEPNLVTNLPLSLTGSPGTTTGPPGLPAMNFQPSLVQSFTYPGAVWPKATGPAVLSYTNAFPNLAFPQHGLPVAWNPARTDANVTISNVGRTLAGNSGGSNDYKAQANQSAASGQKVYWEIVINSTTSTSGAAANPLGVGFGDSSLTIPDNNSSHYLGFNTHGTSFYTSGGVYYNNSVVATWAPFGAAGDNISIAIDLVNNTWWGRVNGGNWNNSGVANPATNTGGQAMPLTPSIYPTMDIRVVVTATVTANFASSGWTYSAPAGFTQVAGSQSQVQDFLYPGAVQPQFIPPTGAFMVFSQQTIIIPILMTVPVSVTVT